MYWCRRITALTVFCSIIAFLFASCYHLDSEQPEDYESFRQNMQGKYVYDLLPPLEDTDCIQEAYLFYSDWDLLDSYYTIYINCLFTEEEYQAECERITNTFTDPYFLTINSDSFGYPSMSYDTSLEADFFGVYYIIR